METEVNFTNSAANSTELSNISSVTTDPSVVEGNNSAEIFRLIHVTVRPILIIGGTAGNVLTLYITRRPSLKNVSTCFYMFLLALADTMALWSGCLGGWVRYLTRDGADIRKWTDCKLYYFMYDFGRHYSSMLLVLMSIEKCFAVYFPFKSKTICTVKTTKWATGIVGIILAVYDSVQSYYRKSIMKSSGQHSCVYTSDISTFRSAISSLLYSLGPFTLMFLSNVAIVFKLMRAKCESNSTESTSQALAKSATRGTAMVVTVSITFLILTAPIAVEYAHTLRHAVRLTSNPVFNVYRYLTQYLNHSINGVLYIIVGTRFRNELLKIFRRKERSEDIPNSHSSINTSLTTVGGTKA